MLSATSLKPAPVAELTQSIRGFVLFTPKPNPVINMSAGTLLLLTVTALHFLPPYLDLCVDRDVSRGSVSARKPPAFRCSIFRESLPCFFSLSARAHHIREPKWHVLSLLTRRRARQVHVLALSETAAWKKTPSEGPEKPKSRQATKLKLSLIALSYFICFERRINF